MRSDATTCPWYVRWWHRRLRNIDRQMIWVGIRESTTSLEKRAMAWQLFIIAPGQEHWRCACGAHATPFELEGR